MAALKERTTVLKVLAGTSLQAVMKEVLPRFERDSGTRVDISYAPAKLMLERIGGGEVADMITMSSPALDELAAQGRIAPGSRRNLARNGIGIAVRAGAPKPDISSVDAFRSVLLAAKSIACTSAGASGIYFAGLIERLGIAEPVRAKAVMRPGGLTAEFVASGEAEIAIQQIPELMAVPGIEVLDTFPQEFQVTSTVAACVFTHAAQPQAARALIALLASEATSRIFKAKGFEPLNSDAMRP